MPREGRAERESINRYIKQTDRKVKKQKIQKSKKNKKKILCPAFFFVRIADTKAALCCFFSCPRSWFGQATVDVICTGSGSGIVSIGLNILGLKIFLACLEQGLNFGG